MPAPMPPQGAPAPQAAPSPEQEGGESPVAQAVSMGFQSLMTVADAAKQAQASPDTMKYVQAAVSAFQQMVDHLGQPEGAGEPEPQQGPGAPLPPNAAPNSKPVDY